MSPPAKAPPEAELRRDGEQPGHVGAGQTPAGGGPVAAPQAAVLAAQRSAGNQAVVSALGASGGIQRAPNDEDAPDGGPVPNPTEIRAQRVEEGLAEMERRTAARGQRANVQPINDPDEAARIYLDQRAGAGGNTAVGRNDIYRDKWRHDHQQHVPAPAAGWRNADGTVVIDKSNPAVKEAVERLARERGGGGGSAPPPPAGGAESGGGPAGSKPDRGDPRRSGMAHGPTLDSSGGVATAPTMPGPQRGDPRRSGMAYGPTLDSAGGAGTGPTSPGAPGPGPATPSPGPGPAPGPGPGTSAPGGGGPSGPTMGGSDEEGDFWQPAPRRGKHPAHIKPAVPATRAEAEAAYRRDPNLVFRSRNDSLHDQYWRIDPATATDAPGVYRSGNTYIVAPDVTGPGLPPPHKEVTEADPDAESANVKALGEALDKRRAERAPVPVAEPSAGQRRIDPYARRRDPEPGMKQAVPVTHDEVVEALRTNPDKVYQSKRYDTHAEWYTADRGPGAWPRAFRSGSTIIIDPDYPLDGRPPGPKPTTPTEPTTGPTTRPTTSPAPAPPDPTRAAQTISPTGYVPQERKPAKWDVKGGEISRETAREEQRTTDQGTDTRIKSSEKSYGIAKGAGQEWKQRDESQGGDAFSAKEKSTRVNASLAGLALNRGSATETGTTADGPKTRTERNIGGQIGPDGAGGTASTAITSQSGTKAEAKGDVKIGPDGIQLTGTGSITTSKGFTGHLSVSGKSSAVARDPKPLANGKFAVDFVMTDENGVEVGGGWSKPGGGPSVGVELGSSTSTSNYQTRVFDSRAEAVKFQLTAAMQISTDPRSFEKATSSEDVLAMQEGEVRGTSKTDTDSLGGSGGMSVVSVGVTSTDSTTTGLKIEKMAGNRVRVTPSIAEQEALNASISVGGKFGNTKGESTTRSFSVTYEFDLGSEGGKQAYETYKRQRLPPPMPPHAKWIDTTTGRAFEDHDVYKFAHIGEIGWGSHATQQTVVDESGTHTTAVGGQTEKVELNALRKLTFDKNRHAEANIVGRMTNGQVTSLAGQLTVGGEDGSFNREQFRKIFSDRGAPPGTEVRSSGEWTLSAEIDRKMFEQRERDNDRMKLAKTREERLKIYSEMARAGGAEMLGGQVRGGGGKLAWNLELKGDPNFPGATGRAALNQQRRKLQAQLKERPANAGSVASEAKDAITALTKRLQGVSDKKRYTDLPDELRQEQVDLITTHIAEFKSVRSQALSVQLRGGRKEDLTDTLKRAASDEGYRNEKQGDRGWRKLQDLITVHETEVHALEVEITGVRTIVAGMIGRTGDVRWGEGVHQKVFLEHNANAKRYYSMAMSMAPRLTEAVGKLRELKDSWSADPDPKTREDKLRTYDRQLLDVIKIMDLMLESLRDTARSAYIVTTEAVVDNKAAWKLWDQLKVDRAARGLAINTAAGHVPLDEL